VVAVEPPGVLQDAVRDPDLADVVHRRRELDRILFRRGETDAPGDQRGILRHPDQVHSGHLVALLGRLRQAKQGLDLAPAQLARRLVDLLLQDPRSVLLQDLVAAPPEPVAAAPHAPPPLPTPPPQAGPAPPPHPSSATTGR